MDLEKLLKVAVRGGASDIILKTGSVPKFRFQGNLIPLSDGVKISNELMQAWIQSIVPPHLTAKLSTLDDLDFAHENQAGNRFRVNIFRQRGQFGIVFRVISGHVRTLEELQFPRVLESLCREKRGLILVTGATGSGKSTTLAALIEKMNATRPVHIITIEDPVEFLFQEKMATVNQREIGIDAISFGTALRSALRQNPDVILVGELRDRETTETALMAAETGHLVLSTLHTSDAVESVTRLLSYFDPHQHSAIKLMLSQSLKAIVSQRLVNRADKKGLVAALEILIVTALMQEEIQKGENLETLKDAIANANDSVGMQTFDQALLKLARQGTITEEEALHNASNKKDLRLSLSGVGR